MTKWLAYLRLRLCQALARRAENAWALEWRLAGREWFRRLVGGVWYWMEELPYGPAYHLAWRRKRPTYSHRLLKTVDYDEAPDGCLLLRMVVPVWGSRGRRCDRAVQGRVRVLSE